MKPKKTTIAAGLGASVPLAPSSEFLLLLGVRNPLLLTPQPSSLRVWRQERHPPLLFLLLLLRVLGGTGREHFLTVCVVGRRARASDRTRGGDGGGGGCGEGVGGYGGGGGGAWVEGALIVVLVLESLLKRDELPGRDRKPPKAF